MVKILNVECGLGSGEIGPPGPGPGLADGEFSRPGFPKKMVLGYMHAGRLTNFPKLWEKIPLTSDL